MGRKVKIALNIAALLAIVGYMTVTIIAADNHSDMVRFSRLDVTIVDSADIGFVTHDTVERLVLGSVAAIGHPLSNIHLGDIEERLEANQYVDSVEVSSSIDGVIKVRLRQRRPIMRVLSENGYNFLVDSALNIMRPTDTFHPKVPIISGVPCFGFSPDFYGRLDRKKYAVDAENLKKLINFVQIVASDEFLDRLCAQIFVACRGINIMEVEIVPTMGRSTIKVGELNDSFDKLNKVKAFYRSAYSYAGLDTAQVVDIRFKDQILVR